MSRPVPRTCSMSMTVLLSIWMGAISFAQEVTLPLEAYEALRSRAAAPVDATVPPPAPFAFEAAELRIEVGATVARVEQHLEISVLADGWQRIPLAVSGSLADVELGAAEARLVAEPVLAAELSGPGRHRLRLTSALPLAVEGAADRFARVRLEMPAAAIVTGIVDLAGTDRTLTVRGPATLEAQRGTEHRFTAASGSVVDLLLERGVSVASAAGVPVRFSARTALTLDVSRAARNVEARCALQVLEGRLESIEIPVPEGYDIVDVRSEQRLGWRVEDGHLHVTLGRPVEDAVDVTIRLRADAADRFVVPVMRPSSAEHVMTVAGTRVVGDGLLELVDPGRSRVPASTEERSLAAEVTARGARPQVLPDGEAPPTWQIAWDSGAEVLAAQVDRALLELVLGPGGDAVYRLWIEVRNAGAAELAVTLPPGITLVEASRDGVPLVPGLLGQALHVPLAATDQPQTFHATFLARLQAPEGRRSLVVPLPTLSAPATRAEARLLLPRRFSYALEPASRRGSVAPPPGVTRAEAKSILGQQLASVDLPDLHRGRSGFLDPPPGYRLIQAAWSPLSRELGDLALIVSSADDRAGWF